MNKKTVKLLSVLLTFAMVMLASTSAFAVDIGNFTGDTNTNAANAVLEISNSIIGILTVAGMAVSIIVLIVLGIKYMMGSTAEKAEYKKTLMPYFIGGLLIFGASAIAAVVMNMAQEL